jgi:hypothetical protein
MATAEQYAAWIVANQRQKGTPDFEVVAKAYEEAKALERTSAMQQQAPVAPAPSLGQRLAGAAETGLALGTSATSGVLGFLGGTAAGLGRSIASGTFGTQAGVQDVGRSAQDGMRALTYEPRTELGREFTQATGESIGEIAPPILPILTAPGAVVSGMRQAAPLASRARTMVEPVVQAPMLAAQAVQRAVGFGDPGSPAASTAGMKSVGAAATPLELQRFAEAEMAGLRLSEGEIKRDPVLLSVENEQARTASIQGPFLKRQRENNQAALRNLEQVLDSTDAQTGDLANTGIRVVDVLMSGWGAEKKKTSSLYNAFRASPEAKVSVDTTPILNFLNEQARGVSGITGVPDTARQNAVALGIAAVSPDGRLIATPGTTIGKLEEFRQSVSAIKATNPNDKRLASLLKQNIDAVGDPIGGERTRAMRAQRQRQAQKYENPAIVSRLLLERKGTDDPQTPVEDVFQKTILSARPSEITRIKRVLSTIPDADAQQAWREIQGATVRHLMSNAESGIGQDNLPVISGAKLDAALKAFDQNGKLDLVMGKAAAEQIRNLNQVLKYIQSTPPLTSINNSGTARTIVALMGESVAQSALTGIPFPILQASKLLRDNIKDSRTRARITKALNYRPKGSGESQ